MMKALAITLLVVMSGGASAKFSPVDQSLTRLLPDEAPIDTTVAAATRESAYFSAPSPAYGLIFQCRPRDMVFFTGLIRYARACD